ncbi:HEPN domain-containing protein [Trichormus sp. NMC-1]|uniref:HEPN domain-containing protein n=1 Tax=Trichormus sp. NMC-1 TaxID=1853259 RepID=UPI0008DC1FC2|nr:HEPN domain-containing protein [Trichormus sp. NMC-1]
MSESSTFLTLNRELNRLKEEFIPEISPTGSYSESQLSKTAAYRVFAHAEIEYYLEERAWEIVQNAKSLWDTTGKTTRTLICLLGFSGLTMDEPPDTLTPKKGSKTVKEEKIKISKKIDLALESFKRVISQNHGVKEDHILALLLPIGIDSDDLDPAWLATMNTFGENRGKVAHKSATSYRTFQPPDPATELNTVKQITEELLKIDELINNLM